jgi:hypothetical protein
MVYYLIETTEGHSKILRSCIHTNNRIVVLINELTKQDITLVDDPYDVVVTGRYAVSDNSNNLGCVIYHTILKEGYVYGTSTFVTKICNWEWVYFKTEKLPLVEVNKQFKTQCSN